MMINKRLIGTVSESKKYIAGNVALQWISLAGNIVLMTGITSLLAKLYERTAGTEDFIVTIIIAAAAVVWLCHIFYFVFGVKTIKKEDVKDGEKVGDECIN